MTDLFEKSIQILELPKVLDRLAGQAVTQEGKERCLALRPMTDPDDVQRALDETSAAVDMSALRGSPSFSGVKPVAASLQRAHMGGALNTRELLDIAAVLRAARSAREYGEGDERKKTCIDHHTHPAPVRLPLSSSQSTCEEVTSSYHNMPGSYQDNGYEDSQISALLPIYCQ